MQNGCLAYKRSLWYWKRYSGVRTEGWIAVGTENHPPVYQCKVDCQVVDMLKRLSTISIVRSQSHVRFYKTLIIKRWITTG